MMDIKEYKTTITKEDLYNAFDKIDRIEKIQKRKFNSLYGRMVSEELKEKVYVIYEEEDSKMIHIYGIFTTKERATIEYNNILKYRIINENLYIKEMKVNTFYKNS